MDVNSVVRSSVAVLIPATMVLIAKLMPYKPAQGVAQDIPFEELQRRYRPWEIGSMPLSLLFWVLFTGAWYTLFLGLQWVAYAHLPNSRYLIVPTAAFWLVPSIFLGICSCALPMHFLYKGLLGPERYREYNHYCNLRVKFDAWRVFRWMAIGIGIVALFVIPPALDCYTRFTEDKLADNSVFSICETHHPYADVQELRSVARFRAPNGKVVDKPYYQILFKDGFTWRSTRVMAEPRPQQALEIMNFVSAQTGKKITQYDQAPEDRSVAAAHGPPPELAVPISL